MNNPSGMVHAQYHGNHPKRGKVFGVPVDLVPDAVSLVGSVARAAEAREGAVISYLTADTLVKAKRQPSFRNLLGQCAICYADGMGASLAASLILHQHVKKVTANDCYLDLCREFARKGLVVAFVGGEEGVAQAAAAYVRQNTNLPVAFCSSGYFTHFQEEGILAKLARADPHVVLMAMGQPRQEYYAFRWHHAMPGTLFYCVGGLFDVMTGRVRTPPLFLRRAGFEWVWRLLQSPRRLWRRYLVGLPVLAVCGASEVARTNLRLARSKVGKTDRQGPDSFAIGEPMGER
jgi:exopolysaccharide biosynthesis WecB/TagA/CpsF family protein